MMTSRWWAFFLDHGRSRPRIHADSTISNGSASGLASHFFRIGQIEDQDTRNAGQSWFYMILPELKDLNLTHAQVLGSTGKLFYRHHSWLSCYFQENMGNMNQRLCQFALDDWKLGSWPILMRSSVEQTLKWCFPKKWTIQVVHWNMLKHVLKRACFTWGHLEMFHLGCS